MGSGWVAFGYLVAYGGIGAYVLWIALRFRALRRSDPRRG